jgi:hypothetical protein
MYTDIGLCDASAFPRISMGLSNDQSAELEDIGYLSGVHGRFGRVGVGERCIDQPPLRQAERRCGIWRGLADQTVGLEDGFRNAPS